MNKFRYFSDLHGVNPDFKRETDREEICIIAGDSAEFGKKGVKLGQMLSEICERFKRVIFVPGNHEYYGTSIVRLVSKISHLMKDHDNFTILQGGQFVDIDGVRIIGATLWSDIAGEEVYDVGQTMNDYKYIRIGNINAPYARRLKPHDTMMLHRAHLEAIDRELKNWEGDCIVVTHHAPRLQSIDPRYYSSNVNSAYATNLELERWPNYWIHGHIHRTQSYLHEGCNIVCNPGGYQMEYTGFEPLNNYFYL